MFLLKQILPAVLLAIAVAAVGQSLARWLGTNRVREAGTPVALALGYSAGHWLITGWTSFPPTDTTNWLPYFGLAAAGLRIFWEALAEKPAAQGWLLVLVTIGALRLLLQPKFRHGWTPGQGWAWVIYLGVGVALLGLVFSVLSRRSARPLELPLVMLIVGIGISTALMLSGSFLLGQFGTVFAGAAFGALVFALLWSTAIEGIAPICAMLIGALLASGYFFAQLPCPSALLLAGAPLLALTPTGRLSGLASTALRIVLVSLPVAAAVFVAFRASPPLDY